MSVSSSSSSCSSFFPNSGLPITPCGCGLPPRVHTSRTDKNPNKRFLVCPVGKCGFWEWEDKLELEAMKLEIKRLREELEAVKRKTREELEAVKQKMREDVQDLKQKIFTLMAVFGVFFVMYVMK